MSIIPYIVERGVVEAGDVIVKKLLFSSFDDNWIPANLYLPRHRPGPLPTVVNGCGHNTAGKLGYIRRGVTLARNGYARLAFDLPGMGERRHPGDAFVTREPLDAQMRPIA